jgi:hypothetical protein
VEAISEALHAEPAPLGIHVTIVEPGYFRTDFLDEQSLTKTAQRIEDYAGTVCAMRSFAASVNHEQPGDPAKLAKAMIALVNANEPSAPSAARQRCGGKDRGEERLRCGRAHSLAQARGLDGFCGGSCLTLAAAGTRGATTRPASALGNRRWASHIWRRQAIHKESMNHGKARRPQIGIIQNRRR